MDATEQKEHCINLTCNDCGLTCELCPREPILESCHGNCRPPGRDPNQGPGSSPNFQSSRKPGGAEEGDRIKDQKAPSAPQTPIAPPAFPMIISNLMVRQSR